MASALMNAHVQLAAAARRFTMATTETTPMQTLKELYWYLSSAQMPMKSDYPAWDNKQRL